MNKQRMTWEEISKMFDKEWVELIDYDWPDEEPFPRSGVVRVDAKTRSEFYDLAEIDPPSDSAYIFVGTRERPDVNCITHGFSRVVTRSDHA